MARYRVQGPDGRTYIVEGPDGATQEEVIAAAQNLAAAGASMPSAGSNAARLGQFQQIGDPDIKRMANPTGTPFENFAAGAGKAMYDTARGIGQLAGVVSEEDVAESRRLDAPLMRTTAGQLGNITGYAAQIIGPGAVAGGVAKAAPSAAPAANAVRAAFLPASLPGNIAQGAALGALQPTVQDGERLNNVFMGGGFGGVGYMIPGAVRAGKAALIDPLTDKGNERILARALQQSADDPSRLLNPQTSAVPGFQPNLAEATLDPGIAQFQRALANSSPQVQNAITQQQAANNLARVRALEGVAGDVAEAAAKRAEVSAPLYEAARSGVAQVDDQFRALMSRPSIKEGLRNARKIAAEMGDKLPKRPEQFTGAHLQYVDQALSDQIDKAVAARAKGEAKRLIETQTALREWMEQQIPEYNQAQATFRAASREVDQAKIGQQILQRASSNSADLNTGAPILRPDSAKGAIKNLDRTAKAAGVKGDPRQILTAQQQATLDAVADSLDRMTQGASIGQVRGQSATAQNLAGMNALSQLGLPSGLMNLGPVGRLAGVLDTAFKVAGVPERLQARLAQIVVDPQQARAIIAALPENDQGIMWRALKQMTAGQAAARVIGRGANVLTSQQAGARLGIASSQQD